jgi:membrane associated rhomboid family serine protease
MLLLPIGLEDRALRRVPWVTLALIFANVAVLAASSAVSAARSGDVAVLDGLVEKSLEERPYLEADERLSALLGAARRRELEEARALWQARGGGPAAAQAAREQKEFEALVEDYLAAMERLPGHRYGFVPARPSWTALTAMFMHAGWLHLLGNMLFLYVSGTYVEDVYGRPLYLLSYLLGGLAATAGHYLADPASRVPLVGASGAIAAVMGILLVRLFASWVQFLLLPIPFLPNIRVRLKLPALVVLPLWLLEQLAFAQRSRGEGGGVAWWAHIAGFLFGVALAGAIRLFRIEDRSQGRSVAQDESERDVERAAQARAEGDLDRADELLGRALQGAPESVSAWQEAFLLALERSDPDDLARAMTRLLELLQKRNDGATALALLDDQPWRDVPDRPARLELTIGAAYERLARPSRALEQYDAVVEAAPRDALALRALMRKGELLARLGRREEARDALRRAQAHPAMNEAFQATLARSLAKLGG